MSIQSDISLPPYPDEPLYLQDKQAQAAQPASFIWNLLAFIGPNYWLCPVNTTHLAKVVRFHHLPERIVNEPLYLPSPSSSFIESFTIQKTIPEMWFLLLELPSGARLIARTTESYYTYLRENPDQLVSVYYKTGRFDGVPRLYPTGELLAPPSPRKF